jgi:hypothetical protein
MRSFSALFSGKRSKLSGPGLPISHSESAYFSQMFQELLVIATDSGTDERIMLQEFGTTTSTVPITLAVTICCPYVSLTRVHAIKSSESQ